MNGNFGIKEPLLHLQVFQGKLPSLYIIPGRCFDSEGGRIGRGKGFYDKYLSIHQAKKMGVCDF